MVRKAETFPPVTMAHIRGHGCRDLLVYCDSGGCHHGADHGRQLGWPMTYQSGRSTTEWCVSGAACVRLDYVNKRHV
jgi:hypothetical protein